MASKVDEAKAFAKLRAFILSGFPSAQLRWQEGAEPPDFDLFIDDILYAVEITEMRKQFEVGKAQLPFRVIGRELDAFVKRAESALNASGGFDGDYAVIIPRPIPDLRKREAELIALIRGAIEALRDAPQNTKVPVFRIGSRQCWLLKRGRGGRRLTLHGPADSQWGEESRVEVLSLIDQHVENKAQKLRDITVPRLLVLDDKHLYSDVEHFLHVSNKTPACEAFHTIFVARGDRDDVVLTTRFLGARGVWDLGGVS